MRRALLALAAVLAAAAILLAVSGGVRANVGGFRLSAQSPLPALVAAAILAGLWLVLARRQAQVAADLSSIWLAVERRARATILVIALVASLVSSVFATNSASGSDASGYLSQAAMWSHARPVFFDLFGIRFAMVEPMDVYPITPLGWRYRSAGIQVPSYPPGLPLLMAMPHRIAGARGASLVIAVSAVLAVWATGAIAQAFAGGAAGILASSLLAVAPAFLFQSVQPMSDVPVTAAWMMCWWLIVVRRRNFAPWAGVACGVAILIRPNLAPLAAVPFLAIFFSHRREALRFAVPVIVTGAALAALQWAWYGSPFRSGYGAVDELFALSNSRLNLSHYFGWLVATSPLLVAAVAGVWPLRNNRIALGMAAFAVLILAAYLPYAVFEDWSYLRFLLPAMAVACVLVGALCQSSLSRVAPASRPVILFALILVVAGHGLSEARSRDTFKLAEQQRRVEVIGTALAGRMSASDVIVSGEQSGSMRYYTGHDIVRWEELRTDDWDRVFATLDRLGSPSWIVLDAFEEPLFRAKFGAHPGGALDWPPAIDAGDTHRTRAWKLTDRARFAAGENVATERIAR